MNHEYLAATALTKATRDANLPADLVGRRFIFCNTEGEMAVIEGMISGVEVTSCAELVLYVSVPRFLGFKLRYLVLGKTWHARTTIKPKVEDDSYNSRYVSIPGSLTICEKL